MDSTRPELLEDVLGGHEAAGGDIGVGLTESLVEDGTIAFVEPITGVERQELQFGAFRQVRGLIDDQPSFEHVL